VLAGRISEIDADAVQQ